MKLLLGALMVAASFLAEAAAEDSTQDASPASDLLEKLICRLGEKNVEKVINEVCQRESHPADCQTTLDLFMLQYFHKCHSSTTAPPSLDDSGKVASNGPFGLPPVAGKVLCGVFKSAEEVVIGTMCQKVHMPDCHALLQKVFDKLLALAKCEPSSAVSDDFVQGGTLNLHWSDCGDSSYHGSVQSLSPTTLTLGKRTTIIWSGTVNEQVTEGGFDITAKFGPVAQYYFGDLCSQKVFHLPAFLGTITWDGLKCPVAQGSASVGVDVQLSSIIPTKLAKGEIQIKAAETRGRKDNLICLDIKTSAAQTVMV